MKIPHNIKSLLSRMTLVGVLCQMMILLIGAEIPFRFHHHDCEGHVCLTLPGTADPHDGTGGGDECGDRHDMYADLCTPLVSDEHLTLSHEFPPAIFILLRDIATELHLASTELTSEMPPDIPEDYSPPHITSVNGRKSPPSAACPC